MRNKKIYNNLFDSIVMTIVSLITIGFYLLMMYFGVLHPREGTNPFATFIGGTIIFGGLSVLSLIIVFIYCYEYWYLDDKSISSKKLFRKKKVILISQIEKVEKKVVDALIFSTYKSDAYIIYSSETKITILINNQKNHQDLNDILKKHLIS